MPPRLPSRRHVDLVNLSFLLPWAGKSSYTTLPTSSSSSLSSNSSQPSPPKSPLYPPRVFAESSKMASLRQRKKSPGLIHFHLSVPNPPLPSTLLDLVRADNRHLNLNSGMALSSYCLRMGDLKSYRGLWQLMGRKRIAPLSIIRSHLSIRLPLPSSSQSENGISKMMKVKYKIRPNRWAIKMFPPLPYLPSTKFTKSQLIQHLHYLLLQTESQSELPTFEEGLELLKRSSDWSNSNVEYGSALELLNLYLAYTHRSPSSSARQIDGIELVDTYLKEAQGARVNRQTLHLLIKSHISTPISLLGLKAYSPEMKSLKNKILATISNFSIAHQITPGPETYRILARFAGHYKLDDLAGIAWEGWYDAIKLDRLIKRQSSQGDRILVENLGYNSSSSLRVRFGRIGYMNKRWTRVVRLYENLGWIKKNENEDALEKEYGFGYVWLGEKGRLSKLAELKVMEQKEKEVVREEIKLENILNVKEEVEVGSIVGKLDDLKIKVEDNMSVLQSPREEVKFNIEKNEISNQPILSIVKNKEVTSKQDSSSAIIDESEISHHKPPYFVLIRDGSTVKIRSKSKNDNSQIDLDGLDDKPIWE
ncbi:hypothetical protein I204_03403 [Kwoniella mangroviensis CBS 8886]|nr:hypothetical protein I204_03403 [Kwoniella mangroviensis CBS 8886]